MFSVQLGALSTLGHVISHVMSTSTDEEKMDTSDSSTLDEDTVQQAVLTLSKLLQYRQQSTHRIDNPLV